MASLAQKGAAAATLVGNPDALYAAALSSLGANPAVVAVLSPMAKVIFNEIYGNVKGLASQEISSIATAISSGVSAEIPSGASVILQQLGDVVGEVVGEVAPYLAMVVDNVVEIASFSAKFSAPDIAANEAVTARMLTRPVQGTGGGHGGYGITPADIFAPMPGDNAMEIAPSPPGANPGRSVAPGTWYVDPWSGHMYREPWPYSSLGLCLAALTENNGAPIINGGDGMSNLKSMIHINEFGGWSGGDSTIRHDSAAWLLMPSRYNVYIPTLGQAQEPNVGIPHAVQNTMKLLRLAMGSRASTAHGDPSAVLYALWADLFLHAWKSGQMTGGFALFALSSIFGPKGWNDAAMNGPGTDLPGSVDNPFGFIDAHAALQGAGAEQWTPYVLQAATLVQKWEVARAVPVPVPALAQWNTRPGFLASLFHRKTLSSAETVAKALRHGWSPALDGKLPPAMTFALLLEKLRAAARPHLSAAALAKFHPHVNLFR